VGLHAARLRYARLSDGCTELRARRATARDRLGAARHDAARRRPVAGGRRTGISASAGRGTVGGAEQRARLGHDERGHER
jgi:hypothetical protein